MSSADTVQKAYVTHWQQNSTVTGAITYPPYLFPRNVQCLNTTSISSGAPLGAPFLCRIPVLFGG